VSNLSLLWSGNLARTNGPDGFVGNHYSLQVGRRYILETFFYLTVADTGQKFTLVFFVRFSDTRNDLQSRLLQTKMQLGVDVLVGFFKQTSTLRMAKYDILDAH
jgi:hypothetical protein